MEPRPTAVRRMGVALPCLGAVLLLYPRIVSGHGHLTLPPSRNGGTLAKAADCLHGECMWFSQPNANWTRNPATGKPDDPIARIPGLPTVNVPHVRTYNVDISSGPLDYTRTSPWRAPGSAPVYGSGCGVGAGGPLRESDGGTGREFGVVQNFDGKDLPRLNHSAPTVWKRGSVVEVAWANNANHGGGYSYRLCKADGNVTEECFQQGHLSFVGDTQWLQTQSARSAGGVSRDPAHPTTGVCAGTVSFAGCTSATATSGSFHAAASQITDLSECAIFILNSACPRAKYVSFSAHNDDCSWYASCAAPTSRGGGSAYTSVSIRPVPPPPPVASNVTRTAIPRVTVSKGTTPKGSQWARVPIPACRYPGSHLGPNCTAADSAACCTHPSMFDDHRGLSPADQWYRHQSCVAGAAGNGLSGSCAEGHAELQFPEPVPGMSGLWAGWLWCGANGRGEGQDQLGDSPGSRCQSHQLMIATNIVDKVQVPSAIVPGAYLLSWRWDCEQTNQIWQNCADVQIMP